MQEMASIFGLGRSHMPQSNYACASQLLSLCSRGWEPQLLSPHFQLQKPVWPRACAPQQERANTLVSQSCWTLCHPLDCSLPGFLFPRDSPNKNTGVGSHSLLQEIFPTQRENPGLPHCKWVLYQLSYQGRPCNRRNHHNEKPVHHN